TPLEADTDGDGLEDEWELGFFPGDLTKLSGNSDADGDGLNDKGEFLAASDPTNPDTDGDTISDGAEVVSWRSDPTKKDSDGDGLEDQAEIAEDPFLTNPAAADTDNDGLNDGDEIAAGSDPSNPDTDGDSYEDGLEITFGADPTDPASVTGSLVRGGQWKVEMAISDAGISSAEEVDALLDDGAGRVSEVQVTEWDVINFQVTTSVDAFFDTLTTYPILQNPVAQPIGARISGGIFVRETGPVTIGFDSHSGLASLRIDGQEIELTEAAAHGTGRRAHLASVELEAGPHDLVLHHWPNRDTGIYLFSSLQNGTMTEWDASVMELAPAFDIANVMTEDTDGDGLDDFWENFYFGGLDRDGTGDEDGDGLTDKAESENRANPTKKDTDGDGLEDGPEVAEHQTAPHLFDTDGDAIGDGAEVNDHQTNPNLRDTDEDGIDDNIEITLGSSPNDPEEIPATVVLLRDQATGRSWQDGSFWSDGQPVGEGKTYQVGGVPGLGATLRSPASLNPVFPGATLSLQDGSTLRLKHGGTASFPTVTAENATIQQGQANQTIGVMADIEVTNQLTFNVQGENRRLDYSGQLSGTGTLLLNGVLGGELALSSPVNAFQGDIIIEDITAINAAPGSIGRSNVIVSGELWSDARLNLAGQSLTLVGSEVRLQMDRDIYVSQLLFQPDREEPQVFDLDGLLGGEKGTTLESDWFSDSALGTLNELVVSTDGNAEGRIIFSDDADGDGLPDAWETENGLDPGTNDAGADKDGDGLSNELEFYLSTNLDGADSDGDGLADGDEFNIHGSDPSAEDSDGDGLADGAEVNNHETNPALADSDGDGLNDGDEINTHGTNPTTIDSDGDGTNDGVEVASGSDPTDPASRTGVWFVRTAESSTALTSNAAAEALHSGENLIREVSSQHQVVNFVGTGGSGNFGDDASFPNQATPDEDINDFSLLTEGKFAVAIAGTYTIGFNSDDGGLLEVNGERVVEFDGTRGAGDSLGSVELSEGEHQLRFIMWDRGGGSSAEVFITSEPGVLDAFSADRFELLTAVPSDAPTEGNLADGLQGYWPMDEGAGSGAVDVSGMERNSETLSGQLIWAEGRFGNAVDFDGQTSLHTPTYHGIGGATPRTISMWIKTAFEVPTGATGLMGFGVSANEQKWHFKVENTTKGLRTENQGGNNFGEIVVNDGQWHHVVSVFPEGGTVIGDVIHYVDGVADEAKNGGLTRPVNTETNPDNGARTLSIGSAFQGEDERFMVSLIDEVAIWDRALTEAEIARLGAEPLTSILGIDPPTPVIEEPGTAPQLLSVTRTAGGIAVTLPEGETYDIEYSPNLIDWSVIATEVSGTYEDTDAGRTGNAEGFYRGVRR
ncbi:MAG: LamG-like jellyroll fold domain-containing protein, partial [Verrucomicrobiota bacterium]